MSANSTFNTRPQVIFVRHAETVSNKVIHDADGERVESTKLKDLDPFLTTTGLNQASKTAVFLSEKLGAHESRVHVWFSPFSRTQLTMYPFVNVGVKYQLVSKTEEPLLQEQIPEETPIPYELQERGVVHTSWLGYMENVKKLVNKIKDKMKTMEGNEYLVIFGHSLTISLAISFMAVGHLKIAIEALPVTFHLPNCSVSVVGQNKFLPESWEVYQVGSVAHLPPDLITGIHSPFGFF